MNELLEKYNDEESQSYFTPEDIKSYKIIAIAGYIFPILFFVTILSNRTSVYCRFHANQQLAWLIVTAALGFVSGIFGLIPILGIIVKLVVGLATIAAVICLIWGVAKDMAVKLPVIGDIFKVF